GSKPRNVARCRCGGEGRENADQRADQLLLRARRGRPRCRRAAEQRDELAPFHSMTSSARESTSGGMKSPSTLAGLRLITSSNLVDCSTGRSEGTEPLRIF